MVCALLLSSEKRLRDYDNRHIRRPCGPSLPDTGQHTNQYSFRRSTSSIHAMVPSNSSESFRDEIIGRVSVEPIRNRQLEDSSCGMLGMLDAELAAIQTESEQDVKGSTHIYGREGQDRPMSRLGRGPPSDVGSVGSLGILSK